MKKKGLWFQLANAINIRSSQDQVTWSIFGTFWAANAILLVALFPGGIMPTKSFASILICVFGIFLSIVWFITLGRSLKHLGAYEELIQKLEEELGIDLTFAVSLRLNLQLYDKFLRNGTRSRDWMNVSPIGTFLIWLILLVILYR